YGAPDDLKRLIDQAHALKIMVLLDVVYNHFGPSGNFLPAYASAFFKEAEKTPWGAAINFDGPQSSHVRNYFIHNALYWLEEFHFDGLRFDAVHAFVDQSEPSFLEDLGSRIKKAFPNRRIHLVLENEKNAARWLARENNGGQRLFTAQWNDDLHHCWHRLMTGESEGYYEDFDHPARRLGRGLAEGFVYQGETSRHLGGQARGEPSSDLPPPAFVAFLQNHDQIGNRAFGERIAQLASFERVSLANAVLLLCPQIPMFFMGEEWDASAPFLYFFDIAEDPALSKAVREGRQREFARFAAFAESKSAESIPDPTAASTFTRSKIDWSERAREPHAARLAAVRELLRLRREHIVPLIASKFVSAAHAISDQDLLCVDWRFGAGRLRLVLNVGAQTITCAPKPGERRLWASPAAQVAPERCLLPSWTALFMTGTASDA
ncbi:MAG TPA: alpha-amylase family glycosyl hydrolase, partial [Beijerinckiaceae bacterium]|nr:alpha-amylase family glycosyl hydrolase [Beijerinckiaceae bacterium]